MRERAWEVKVRRTDRRVGPAFPPKPESVEGELLCSVWVALSETEEHVYRFRCYAPGGISNFPSTNLPRPRTADGRREEV